MQQVIYKVLFTKEIKNAPECIVELHKHTGIFKNTREVHREARDAAKCFSHFSSALKNSQVLINNARGESFFFYEMLKKLRALKLVM